MKNWKRFIITTFTLLMSLLFCDTALKANCDSLINNGNSPVLTNFQDSLVTLCKYSNTPIIITADCYNNPLPANYEEVLVAYITKQPVELNEVTPITNYYGGITYYYFETIGTGINEGFISEDFYEEIEEFYRWGTYLSPFRFLYLGYVFKHKTSDDLLTNSIYGAIPVSFNSTFPVEISSHPFNYLDCPPKRLYSYTNNTLNHSCVNVDYPYLLNFYIDDNLKESHLVNNETEDTVKTGGYNISVGKTITFEYINSFGIYQATKTEKIDCYDNWNFFCNDGELKPIFIDWCSTNDTIQLLNELPYFIVDVDNELQCDYGDVNISAISFLEDQNNSSYVNYTYQILKENLLPYLNQYLHFTTYADVDRAGPPGQSSYTSKLGEIPVYFQNNSMMTFNCGINDWDYNQIPPTLNNLTVDFEWANCANTSETPYEYEIMLNDSTIVSGLYQDSNINFNVDLLHFKDLIHFVAFDNNGAQIFKHTEQFLCDCGLPAPYISNEYNNFQTFSAETPIDLNIFYHIYNPSEFMCANYNYTIEWVLFDAPDDLMMEHKVDLDLIEEQIFTNPTGIFWATRDFEEYVNRWLNLGIQVSVLDDNNTVIEEWLTPVDQVFFNFCHPNLVIDEATPFQNLYQSNGNITTNGFVLIDEDQAIEYNANRVTLNEGFKARAGADFKVRSSGCN